MKPFIEFKESGDQNLFFFLHPFLMMIATDMAHYCYLHNQPFMITDTVSSLQRDLVLKRKSDTHRTNRAIDLRTHHYTKSFLFDFVAHFDSKYGKFGAVVDGKPNLLVVKSDHIHVQLNREFSISL
jgi:hypothetical protein